MGKDGKRKRETDSEDAKKEQATAGGSHYYAEKSKRPQKKSKFEKFC